MLPIPASLPRLRRAFGAAALAAASLSAGPVITWVPPYYVNESEQMLVRDFGGIGMKDGLTYLALQFWVCDGPNIKQWGAVSGPDFDATVRGFRDWGRANGVKVTLCVVNNIGGWNWNEARRSFVDNRAAFIRSLVDEADRLGLDGVDLDLEGPVTPTASDSVNYIAFTRDLAAALNPKGKVVNVATYCAMYNAPNWNWWRELMKYAAAVTSMGYDEAGMNSPAGWRYPEQKKRADPAWKLMIGMLGSSESWQGNTASQHLDYVLNDGQMGLAIWDATIRSPFWHSGDTWRKIKRIKDNTPGTPVVRHIVPRRGSARPVLAAGKDVLSGLMSEGRLRILDLQGREISDRAAAAPAAGPYVIPLPAR